MKNSILNINAGWSAAAQKQMKQMSILSGLLDGSKLTFLLLYRIIIADHHQSFMNFGTEKIMEVRKMNDYNRYDFYSHYDRKNNTRHYFMKVDHKMIEVDKSVFNICFNSYKKQLRDNKRDEAAGLISMDMVQEDGMALLDRIGTYKDPIDTMDTKDRISQILTIIGSLDEEDKNLITDLLINERKEKEIAAQYQLSQQMINKRKQKILRKIRKRINSGC